MLNQYFYKYSNCPNCNEKYFLLIFMVFLVSKYEQYFDQVRSKKLFFYNGIKEKCVSFKRYIMTAVIVQRRSCQAQSNISTQIYLIKNQFVFLHYQRNIGKYLPSSNFYSVSGTTYSIVLDLKSNMSILSEQKRWFCFCLSCNFDLRCRYTALYALH